MPIKNITRTNFFKPLRSNILSNKENAIQALYEIKNELTENDDGSNVISRYYTDSSSANTNSIIGIYESSKKSMTIYDVNSKNLKTINNESIIGDGNINTIGRIDSTADVETHGEIFNDYINNKAIGNYSHSEGKGTTASGNSSHAEGLCTITSNEAEHASGKYNISNENTIFSVGTGMDSSNRKNAFTIYNNGGILEGESLEVGSYAHAEGKHTKAVGEKSHAEGNYTKSTGICSHTEGNATNAYNNFEHAEGAYNVSHFYTNISSESEKSKYSTLHSIGIGTSDSDRKNTFEITSDGKIFITGIGNYKGNETNYQFKAWIDNNNIKSIQDIINNKLDLTGGIINGPLTIKSSLKAENIHIISDNGTIIGSCWHSGNAGSSNYNWSCKELNSNYIKTAAFQTQNISFESSVEGNPDKYSQINDYYGALYIQRDSLHNTIFNWNSSDTNSGRVGIGTNEPKGKLSVCSTDDIPSIFISNNSNTDLGIALSFDVNEQSLKINGSVSEGYMTTASRNYSHSEGIETTASGWDSHSEGNGTTASGNHSHSEGKGTTASGNYGSHAEGESTEASGDESHAEGYYTYANGISSHAEGDNTKSIGDFSHSEGVGRVSSGRFAVFKIDVILVTSTSWNNPGSILIKVIEQSTYQFNSVKIGDCLKINGIWYSINNIVSTSENQFNIQFNEQITDENIITGVQTISMVNGGVSIGKASHSENFNTKAIGDSSHSEGFNSEAIGGCSHAEGYETSAKGGCSHTEGQGTETRKNYSHAEGYYTDANGVASHAEGDHTEAAGDKSHAEGNYTKAMFTSSHAEGDHTIANLENSHAEGNLCKANGKNSHAEGYNTEANVFNSHSEGNCTIANGKHSHAEGSNTSTLEDSAHAEGANSIAKGKNSHAEGQKTKANGLNSHAEGYKTITNNEAEHAEGSFNISILSEDNSKATQHSIGGGDSESNRLNLIEIKKDGSLYIKGIGTFDGKNPSEINSLQALIITLTNKISNLENEIKENAEVTARALNNLNDKINNINGGNV